MISVISNWLINRSFVDLILNEPNTTRTTERWKHSQRIYIEFRLCTVNGNLSRMSIVSFAQNTFTVRAYAHSPRMCNAHMKFSSSALPLSTTEMK